MASKVDYRITSAMMQSGVRSLSRSTRNALKQGAMDFAKSKENAPYHHAKTM